MQANYNTYFANQSKILGQLSNIFTPIAQAGPDQQGMGAAELAAVNTGAQEGVAANYAKASRALNTTLATRGGGSEVLPTGARAALQGQLASAAANESSRESQAITEQNYALGRENWARASAGLSQLGQMYNPNAAGSGAQEGFQSSFGMAKDIAQQQSQKQAAIAGGIASLAMDAATFGMGGIANLGNGGWDAGAFFKGGLESLGGKKGGLLPGIVPGQG
jgi:hypothetical protein